VRTFVRPALLSVSLALLACAARAQPAGSSQTPQDEPCRAAARKYTAAAFPESAHLTVEEVYAAALDAGRKYLSLCGTREDAFTLRVRASVASGEAARRCETETWPLYSERVEVADTATPEQKRQAYEAAREFLRICRYDNRSTWRATRRVEEYEAALRVEEAEKTLAALVPAARAARAGETAPETYARIAEAYAAARVEPSLLRFVRLNGREKAAYGSARVTAAEVREARAQFDAALDRVIDAYARALASCGERESCRESKASWKRQLGIYYSHRHGGDYRGLEETIARAFDAPMPNP
jgi:hypothetical protein